MARSTNTAIPKHTVSEFDQIQFREANPWQQWACLSKPENGNFRVQVWKLEKSSLIFGLETQLARSTNKTIPKHTVSEFDQIQFKKANKWQQWACESKPENGSFRVQVWKTEKSSLIFVSETEFSNQHFFPGFNSKLMVWLLHSLTVLRQIKTFVA